MVGVLELTADAAGERDCAGVALAHAEADTDGDTDLDTEPVVLRDGDALVLAVRDADPLELAEDVAE